MRPLRTRAGKGSALALAALCLLGPVLSYAHMLLVAHARCAEHGELLHLAGPSGAGGGARPETPADGATVDADASPPAGSHDHDHCVVASGRKTETAVPSTGPALAIDGSPAQHAPDEGAAACPAVPLYALAPKNSPPA